MDTPTEPMIECVSTATDAEMAVPESESESVMPSTTALPPADGSPHDQEMSDDDSHAHRMPNSRVDTQRHLSAPLHEVPSIEMDVQDANQPQPQHCDDQNDLNTAFATEDATDIHGASNDSEQVYSTQIVDNQCISRAKEIHEFVASHLSEAQQTRVLPSLIQQLSQQLSHDVTARGEHELSVDIQSSLCVVEQMFLPLGRRSPLQNMYTAEEEEMLTLLAGPPSHRD